MAPYLFLANRGSAYVAYGAYGSWLYWSAFAGDLRDPYSLGAQVSSEQVSYPLDGGLIPPDLAASAVGPALAVFQGKLIMVWSVLPNDPGGPEQGLVWWSSFDPELQGWTVPAQVPPSPEVVEHGDPGLRTSRSPALAVFEDRLFVACRGYASDGNIHWTSFDGTEWDTTGLNGFSGVNRNVGTANAPTIAAYQGPLDPKPLLYMAWRGIDDDENLWWATFDGAQWTSQRQYGGNATSNGPAMAVFQNQLYMVWNGGAFDSSIWFTSFNGEGRDWYPRQQVPGVGTNESPAVTVFQDRLYMAWRDLDLPFGTKDPSIAWSFFDGQAWATWPGGAHQGQMLVTTDSGPALAAFDEMLIPFSLQTRLSRLTHELQQTALESRRLLGQALILSERTRQLGQTAIETARSLLAGDQEDEEDEDDESG